MRTTCVQTTAQQQRLFYRKEKLRGASWEYEISGGWLTVYHNSAERHVLRHVFDFYRPREATIRTIAGNEIVQRTAAEQWFFPDRWFSLLRFTTTADRTIGYYVNFSRPLSEVRPNYYADLDLELDLWLDLDGTITELDRDQFEREVLISRIPGEWAAVVNETARRVTDAVLACVAQSGPDIEKTRDSRYGIPEFILKA